MITSTRTPEIEAARAADEKIAAAWGAYYDIAAQISDATKAKTTAQKSARHYKFTPVWLTERIVAADEKIAALQPAADEARAAAVALDKELYTGWSRFFRVEHIHSSARCSSFRLTTRVGWLPSVSGLTEAEAVAEYGAILCTICFPSAPTEWTEGAKDDRCAGSGTAIRSDLPRRAGYVSGNWATCPDCGKKVGVSSKGQNIPKHLAV